MAFPGLSTVTPSEILPRDKKRRGGNVYFGTVFGPKSFNDYIMRSEGIRSYERVPYQTLGVTFVGLTIK